MKNRPDIVVVFGCLLFLLVISVKTLVNIKNVNDLTLYQINERRLYFPKPIARLVVNKLQTALNLSVNEIFTLFPREL